MGNDPLRMRSATGTAFLGAEPTKPAILPDGEFSLTDKLRELFRGVPFSYLLPLNKIGEHGFDLGQTHHQFIDLCGAHGCRSLRKTARSGM
jgi:hypothetical protein